MGLGRHRRVGSICLFPAARQAERRSHARQHASQLPLSSAASATDVILRPLDGSVAITPQIQPVALATRTHPALPKAACLRISAPRTISATDGTVAQNHCTRPLSVSRHHSGVQSVNMRVFARVRAIVRSCVFVCLRACASSLFSPSASPPPSPARLCSIHVAHLQSRTHVIPGGAT